MELNERNPLIDEILDKYIGFLSQGRTAEQAYDLVVLQGHDKSLVDLCLVEAQSFSIRIQSEIASMAKRGLSPSEVVQVLQEQGYPDFITRSHMELFLNPED